MKIQRTPEKPDGVIARTLFQKTMLTMLIAELSSAFTAIADGVIIGQFLGPSALAASGLSSPYYSIAAIVSGLIMVGSTNLCTKAVGKGDREELSGVFSLTVVLGVICSAALGMAGFFCAESFAALFGAKGASAEVFSATAAYLRGVFVGAPGFIMFVILTPILQLDGDARLAKIGSAVAAVADVVGDLLNVFVFRGGMLGMGLASSFAYYAALLVVLSHFLKKGSLFQFSLSAIRSKMLPPLVKDGLPRGVSMLCRAILPVLINALVIHLSGDLGVTALSAMNSTTFILAALGWGIGGAMLINGGMMVGEQDVGGLKTTIRTALGDILVGVSALAVLVLFFAPWLAALFIPQSGEAQSMAITAIRCYALCLPFLAFNVSTANYFQVISRTLGAYLVNIGIEVACTALMAHLLSSFLGLRGVWIAYPVGQALLSAVILLRILLVKDDDRKGSESHMLLQKGFGVPDEDCIEQSLHSMEEVVALSGEVVSFCAARGIGKRAANRLALCVEEMAGNVIEHGFNDGKPHHLDVRVLVKDGSVILRMRDDCRQFDLREKVKKWAPDPQHPEKNIGIRLVMGMAKDISYTNTMNTNNLIVTV